MAVALVAAVEVQPSVGQPPRAGLGRQRKIGFLGSHEASLKFAPWDDPSWELWGHASSRGMFKRQPDRFFDLHRKECWAKSNNKGQKYLNWLKTNPVPIFMQERFADDVPASIRYPFEEIAQEVKRPYFTSHVAYMIALAMREGATHLGFFGVNYSPDCEYGTQRGSTEYWMGRAEERGIQLVLPTTCTLLADPKELYGYESHDADGKLVHAYTKRVWTTQPDGTTGKPKGKGGLVLPPPGVLEAAKRERELNPPPVGVPALEEVLA